MFPLWDDLRRYSLKYLRGDFTAAISVALMALPQAMAYAFVADLPTSAGIFAAIFGTIFTAAFGSSAFVISGPTNIIAILIQSGTADILQTYHQGVTGSERDLLALQIVLQIVVVIGLIQIFSGLLRLGRLTTQFASGSVIMGYTAGAALTIAVTQIFPFFGLERPQGSQPLFQKIWYLISHLDAVHWITTLIGLGCLLVIIFFHRVSRKIPGPVIVFALAGALVYFFHVPNVTVVEDLGPIYTDLPMFKPPVFELRYLPNIIPLAFAIALLSALQVTMIGRSFASRKGRPYSDDQEVYGLGVSNFLSSFFGAMPSAASFSRSTINYTMGAKTRLAAIFSGGFLFLIVVSLGFLVTKIPLTALSGLMLFTSFTMVNFRNLFLCLRATRPDAFVVIATFLASLLFSLDVALYVGVILSVALYLKQAAVPFLVEYTFNNVGKLRPLDEEDERLDPRIAIVHSEGELFFGAADILQKKLRRVAEDENIQVIILQMMNARRVDATICLSLRDLHKFLERSERRLLISGVTEEVREVFDDAGLVRELGEESFFEANDQLPSEPTRSAYALAKSLVKN